MADLPKSVRIHEEGPREGFQMEPRPIPTARKIEFIEALSDTGLEQITIASFVNPKKVPGMADAEDIVRGFRPRPGVAYRALWLNEKGFERARTVSNGKLAFEAKIGIYASEKFSMRNNNRNTAQEFEYARNVVRRYREYGVPVNRASVSNAFGCNFQGDIPIATVLDIFTRIFEIAEENSLELKEISLADTMAWATPLSIKRTVGAIRDRYPDMRLNLHLHDTRGMGIANSAAGLEMGVDMFDASVAGLGGCPFAGHKGAAGNVCTEDLAFMCEEMGIETGLDLEKLIDCARLAEDIVGHPLPGSVMKGGSLKRLRHAISQG
ncbi:hydroxymethylglutaryl-CoA lyase [Pigmentiphaga soli]|uniref:Hydroxymethylglutaryl-CoA lyase n=1 Tax=Pigmentiphaga soli TaxID=1007095 RepID=A0ABP8H872_9BURK